MKKHDWATGAGASQRKLLQCTAVLCLTLGSAIAFAQNAIQSLSGVAQGSGEVVRIEMTEPLLAIPSGFTIQSPARIALDFPGVANAIGRSTVDINEGNLRSANVVQAGDRTRVVINLKQAASYETKIEGNSLLVVLQRVRAVSPGLTDEQARQIEDYVRAELGGLRARHQERAAALKRRLMAAGLPAIANTSHIGIPFRH